jgi:hypothetical protein
MSKEGENKADGKALRKKLVGINKIALVVSSIATIIIYYKCNISYNIYLNEILCYVVFFLIIFIYLAFYFRLHPKSEEKQCAFSWDSVPGKDNEELIRFLMADLDIDWVENAEIRKSNDGMIISISNFGENLAKIKMDEYKKKAILKTSDGRTYNLKVKTENGKLNIYGSFFIRFKTFIIPFIIKRMRFFALLILLIFIWKSKGISFNDEQLYYWVFSTLAQVFGALLGLLVITITSIIFRFGDDASRVLKCLENIKNEAKYLLYPAGLVLMYSIMALALSQFLITSWFCKVIIIILGIEVPILAISTTPKIMDIFVRCRKEMMESETK